MSGIMGGGMDRQYVIGIIVVAAAVVLLAVMAAEASGAYDVQKVLDDSNTFISHFDYYRVFGTDKPLLIWNPTERIYNLTTLKYQNIPIVQDGPWTVINSSYLAHDTSHFFINDIDLTFSQQYEVSHVEVTLFEYLRSEIDAVRDDNRALNNTVRQQAAHVAQLQAIIFDMGKDIGAMNNTITELQANMTSMKKEMQGIAPLG